VPWHSGARLSRRSARRGQVVAPSPVSLPSCPVGRRFPGRTAARRRDRQSRLSRRPDESSTAAGQLPGSGRGRAGARTSRRRRLARQGPLPAPPVWRKRRRRSRRRKPARLPPDGPPRRWPVRPAPTTDPSAHRSDHAQHRTTDLSRYSRPNSRQCTGHQTLVADPSQPDPPRPNIASHLLSRQGRDLRL
jgi:hypothetical protein